MTTILCHLFSREHFRAHYLGKWPQRASEESLSHVMGEDPELSRVQPSSPQRPVLTDTVGKDIMNSHRDPEFQRKAQKHLKGFPRFGKGYKDSRARSLPHTGLH